jgi:FecR protein
MYAFFKEKNMKTRVLSILIIIFFMVTNSLVMIPSAAAENVKVLGQITMEGDVFIRSSNNTWERPINRTYPLIQASALKTAKGKAALMFKDGSRAIISPQTQAMIDGSPNDYVVTIDKGMLFFNIGSSALLTVNTPSSSVYVNRKDNIVHKVGFRENSSIGKVIVTDKGVEVYNTQGVISASYGNSAAKSVLAGEKFLIANDGSTPQVVKVQNITGDGSEKSPKNGEESTGGGGNGNTLLYVGVPLVIGAGIALGLSGGGGGGSSSVASPSVP